MVGITLRKTEDGTRTEVFLATHNHDSLGEAIRQVPATPEQVRTVLFGHTTQVYGGTRAARKARIRARLDEVWPKA